ncbi:MAG: PP2C family protein-serine/threonine phosphatase [Ignavibacteriae bacterium]|nr:PP2C family protein-serine/threonine phosphatase [Ignavibacteria bacterium]MBI3363466.1 PP2C family protein-serine/threonine phosphatase [Ignavibacteriota bacterium]
MTLPRTAKVSTADRRSESRFDLNALFEFSAIINASLDLTFILGHLLLTLMGKLLATRGVILLEKDHHSFVAESVKGLHSDLTGLSITARNIPQRLLRTARVDVRKYPWIKFFRERNLDLLVPLIARDRTVGIAAFGLSPLKQRLTAQEETYVRSLINIGGSAVEKALVLKKLKDVNRKLDGKLQELATLFELSKEFNATLDTDRLVKLLIFSVIGQIGASKYFVCLQQNDGTLTSVATRLDGRLDTELCAFFSSVSAPVLIEHLTRKRDQQARAMLTGLGIQVLVPLQLQGVTRGMIGLGERLRGEKYGETDLEFLASLSNLAIISLENARLFHETIEKQRLEDELLIAKEIQRGLLPKALPKIPHFGLAATNISSKQVGGDYYDIISLGNSRFVLAIGDVSGKGTPASLLMANLQATIRALVPLGLSLAELTRRVNDLICENTGLDRFITFFWGILDAEQRTMRYVSAGHNPPFLFHTDGTTERLDKGGIILGVMKARVPYLEGEVRFGSGDLLVLFTDGVSEAMNALDEEWGEERLEATAREYFHESPERILSSIVAAVKEHSRSVSQSDDITLVVAKAFR